MQEGRHPCIVSMLRSEVKVVVDWLSMDKRGIEVFDNYYTYSGALHSKGNDGDIKGQELGEGAWDKSVLCF